MLYKIPVSWTAYGEVEVEADDLEEACDIVLNYSAIPWDDAEYLVGSFQVDHELIDDEYIED